MKPATSAVAIALEVRHPLEAASTEESLGDVSLVAEERHVLKAASMSAGGQDGGIKLDRKGQGNVSPSVGQVVPDQESWRLYLRSAHDIAQFGAILSWGLARGMCASGFELLLQLVKPVATHVAFNRCQHCFPLPCDLSWFFEVEWPAGGFCADHCARAWISLSAAALNHLHGEAPPYPRHRNGASVKKAMETLGSRVMRFLAQGVEKPLDIHLVWSEVNEKSVSYGGEEVALAKPLSVEQIASSLPPLGHGGSVELAPLLVGRSRFLIEHPEQVLLNDSLKKPGKNGAKVHIKQGHELEIFRLLHQRGVIEFIPSDEVFCDREGAFLSGLFGVPKPGKLTPCGLPVLRVIMNLIPINRALDVILGDIQELPSASVWQQLVLFEGSSLRVSQADMSSAFYLFRLPPVWLKYLAFNYKIRRSDVGLSGAGFVFPACRVLPMGWSSSVGLMQMASRELLLRSRLPPSDELRRGNIVPAWFVEVSKKTGPHQSWWQVYLDNFMAAEVSRSDDPAGTDLRLHEAAVGSWDLHGVLCSEDKHVRQVEVATELGVQIHGPHGLVATKPY